MGWEALYELAGAEGEVEDVEATKALGPVGIALPDMS
jgi:hypothetical protein